MDGEFQVDDEIRAHLKEHIDFLKKSCRSFDLGDTTEAKRMALSIRILLHDPDRPNSESKSILKLLNRKEMQFYNTAFDYNPDGFLSQFRLLNLGVFSQRYVAPLDNINSKNKGKKLIFDKWWNSIIFKDNKKRTLRRRDIILFLANQDGGAHVDQKINKIYYELSRNNSIGVQTLKDGKPMDLPSPHLYSVRQISHEVLKTLKDEFPEYFIENTIYGLERSKWPVSDPKLGVHFLRRGLFDDAISELKNVLLHDGKDYKLHYYLGRAYLSKSMYTDALKEFDDALKIKPDHPILLNSLGLTFYQKGDYDEAIEQYTKAIKLPQQYAGIHVNLAEALFRKGKIGKSLTEYFLLIRQFPTFARGFHSYGNALFNVGFIHQSIQMYKKAIEMGVSNFDIYHKLSLAFCFTGSFEEAIEPLRVTVRLDPGMVEAQDLLREIMKDDKKSNKLIKESIREANTAPDIEYIYEIESDDLFL